MSKWRRLYNGFYDTDFNHLRLSLEDAAEQVGISKKSLDDYLSQLRSARACGYNFNANAGQKVGHLRRFVKEAMAEHSRKDGSKPKPLVQKGDVMGKKSQKSGIKDE